MKICPPKMETLVIKIANFPDRENLLNYFQSKEELNVEAPTDKKIVNELASIYETICALEREALTWDQVPIVTKDLISPMKMLDLIF
jgi:hypothetical protein